MFTGIIQAMGTVGANEPSATGRRLLIRPDAGWAYAPGVGDSVCVSGCCLTLAEAASGAGWAFDVVPETLAKTTLSALAAGSRVNLERSLAAGDLMGGHLVQGHVDGVAVVERVESREGPWGKERRLTIRPRATAAGTADAALDPRDESAFLPRGEAASRTPTEAAPGSLMEYIVPKGAVALAGVSLTVAAVDPRAGVFEVALIPTTLRLTTLGEAIVGTKLNFEADAMAKTVVHWLRHYGR
ncbi:MAG: riboflavin synthase [Phycisphaerales bacterium]